MPVKINDIKADLIDEDCLHEQACTYDTPSVHRQTLFIQACALSIWCPAPALFHADGHFAIHLCSKTRMAKTFLPVCAGAHACEAQFGYEEDKQRETEKVCVWVTCTDTDEGKAMYTHLQVRIQTSFAATFTCPLRTSSSQNPSYTAKWPSCSMALLPRPLRRSFFL